MSYRAELALAFQRIEQNKVVSSWSDAVSSGTMRQNYMDAIQIPKNGMFFDRQCVPFTRPVAGVLDNIWRIGDARGWYKTDWLWQIRGLMDRAVSGPGLRRGRRSPSRLRAGAPLDFWRGLVADKASQRRLPYAEMKLPGEAWLQFRIVNQPDGTHALEQLAACRPWGLAERLYWYSGPSTASFSRAWPGTLCRTKTTIRYRPRTSPNLLIHEHMRNKQSRNNLIQTIVFHYFKSIFIHSKSLIRTEVGLPSL